MSGGVEMAISRHMNTLAREVDASLQAVAGEPCCFSVIVWRSDCGAFYVDNCERVDVIKGLEQILARWKQGGPDVPLHQQN